MLTRCLEAFSSVMPIEAIYLFGSHARGEAGPDSDIDLCIVSTGAVHQLTAAVLLRRATREIRPKPAFSLLPIDPVRLKEKQSMGDFFFQTILREGIILAA
ncbi:MAG: nucleotidyltransferase domain-containing protein [Spirochaetota bacterium]